jgi:hypothetical protein
MITLLLFGLGACTREDQTGANSEAHKAGKAAYKIAQETREGAEKAGRKVRKAGEVAREGWQDEKNRDQEKAREVNQLSNGSRIEPERHAAQRPYRGRVAPGS